MKQVNKMPESGQFVAVYSYNNKVWSGTYLWDDDFLITEYMAGVDEFEPVGGSGDTRCLPWVCNMNTNPKFFVVV